jgi:hypothetical protein
MGHNKSTRPRMRRIATLTAALAALTMSSGVALMVTATPANAANKVGVCHATSADSNPYVFISVDDDSVKFQGHLKHRNDPNKTWKSDGTFEGVEHSDGDAKPDLIGSYTDDQNVFHEMDGDITAASCDGDVEGSPAIADVDFTDPDCRNQNTASYDPVGQNVTFSLEGTVGPGQHVTVTATADDGHTFDGESTVQEFEHTFGPAEICDIVLPPGEVTPEDPQFIDPDCDTEPAVTLPEDTPVTETPVTEVPIPQKKAAGPVVQTADANGVHYEVTGDIAPGGTVEVDATAIEPNVLAEGATTHWEHTFSEVTGCEAVIPPIATPTVVEAGLTGASVSTDLRGEQGLALLVSGMIMMVIAGGLSLRTRGGVARN